MAMGKSLSEIQKLSSRELSVWWKYREKYGPINPIRMYDQAGAIVATQINNAHGGKAKPINFMPYAKEEEDHIVDGDAFIAMLAKTDRAVVKR